MDIIQRPIYLNRIKPFMGKSLIKVLIGQRRVGKSYLLLQLMNIIKQENPNTQLIYINKEQHEYRHIKHADDLISHIKTSYNWNKKTAIFIDEIQDIKDFEIALRDLATRSNFDVYCTGSNANLLSGEIATFLSGRYVEIKVFGLSYSEYLIFHQQNDDLSVFQDYLRLGGLPYLIHLSKDENVVDEYLNGIYNTIVLKDVVARFNIRNVHFLKTLISFVADNTGSIVSGKKISDFLKSQGVKISPQLVLDYLSHLEASFLINKIQRAGIEGKRLFEIGEKYYFEDLGVRNSIVGFRSEHIHKILENIVYLHLRMAGYEVNVGVQGEREIDFIATKGNEKIYVQVTYVLANESTVEREFGNLLSIPDNYSKYVVSMDALFTQTSHKGIHHIHVKDFCKNLV